MKDLMALSKKLKVFLMFVREKFMEPVTLDEKTFLNNLNLETIGLSLFIQEVKK